MVSVVQGAAELQAVKVGGLKRKSATLAITQPTASGRSLSTGGYDLSRSLMDHNFAAKPLNLDSTFWKD